MFNRKLLRSKFSEIAGWDTDVTRVIVETGSLDYLKPRAIEAIKKGELDLAIFLLGVALIKRDTECPLDMDNLKHHEKLEVARLQAELSDTVSKSAVNPDAIDAFKRVLEGAKKIAKCKHKLQKATDGRWVCLKCKASYGS